MKYEDALKIAALAPDVLRTIKAIADREKALAALAAIKSIATTLLDGLEGKTSPQVVLSHLESLQESLRGNDAAADAAIDRKFRG
jgi:hypothetical protein